MSHGWPHRVESQLRGISSAPAIYAEVAVMHAASESARDGPHSSAGAWRSGPSANRVAARAVARTACPAGLRDVRSQHGWLPSGRWGGLRATPSDSRHSLKLSVTSWNRWPCSLLVGSWQWLAGEPGGDAGVEAGALRDVLVAAAQPVPEGFLGGLRPGDLLVKFRELALRELPPGRRADRPARRDTPCPPAAPGRAASPPPAPA